MIGDANQDMLGSVDTFKPSSAEWLIEFLRSKSGDRGSTPVRSPVPEMLVRRSAKLTPTFPATYHSAEARPGIPKVAIENQATKRPAAIGIFVSTAKAPACARLCTILPRLRRGGHGPLMRGPIRSRFRREMKMRTAWDSRSNVKGGRTDVRREP